MNKCIVEGRAGGGGRREHAFIHPVVGSGVGSLGGSVGDSRAGSALTGAAYVVRNQVGMNATPCPPWECALDPHSI